MVQSDVIAFLSAPRNYGPDIATVERQETHASIVFLAGAHAYKLKRAVKYPYLDYSTAERRRLMCECELSINRRTAPQLYLEVRPIVRDGAGNLRFGAGGQTAGAIDWVVVMRRFDQACLFGALSRSRRLTGEMARQLGETVARFHAGAERAASFGGAAQISAVVEENLSLLRAVLNRETFERLDLNTRTAFAGCRQILDARKTRGFVRHCHGDLHLDNVCLIDGEPVLIDAIEFNDEFACIDVLYDLAFPLMELSRYALKPHANALLNRYLEHSGDHAGLSALPLFLSCRAAIRAHVAVARARATQRGAGDAAELSELAIRLLAPIRPQLIAVGGISGTGKSTLAYALAPDLNGPVGAVVIRSDIIRKRLLGASETERLPENAYTPAMHARVFAAMHETAGAVLRAGFSVVLDGVYGVPEERRGAETTARDAGAHLRGFWLEAPQQTLETRIANRRGDASDATIAVMRRQSDELLRPQTWAVLDANRAPDHLRQSALNALSRLENS